MTSYTFSLKGLPGGLELTGTVETEKELFRQVHFWQGLPAYCPIDGTATVLAFKEPDDFQYYSLQSTGWPVFEYKLGQHKTKGTLFPKGQWTHYDGQSETVIWENGRFTPAGMRYQQGENAPQPQAQSEGERQRPAQTSGGACSECRAPAGKPHATSCSQHVKPKAEPAPDINSLDDVGELDYDGPPTANDEFNSIPSPAKGQTASAHTSTQAETPAKMGDKTRRHFHAVGVKLYGDDWEDKRYEIVKAITKGTAESSNDLTEAQAKTLITGMEKRIAEAQAEASDIPA